MKLVFNFAVSWNPRADEISLLLLPVPVLGAGRRACSYTVPPSEGSKGTEPSKVLAGGRCAPPRSPTPAQGGLVCPPTGFVTPGLALRPKIVAPTAKSPSSYSSGGGLAQKGARSLALQARWRCARLAPWRSSTPCLRSGARTRTSRPRWVIAPWPCCVLV